MLQYSQHIYDTQNAHHRTVKTPSYDTSRGLPLIMYAPRERGGGLKSPIHVHSVEGSTSIKGELRPKSTNSV